MNQKNIDYLEKGLYYTGFGIEVNKTLNEHIAKATPAFSIPLEMTVAGKETSFRLDFKQSEKEPDMYFFNGYQATLKSDPQKTQFFAINKNHGITTREAINLLEGRTVAKSVKGEDGNRYEIWTQIDFSGKKDNGNYNRNVYFPAHGFDAAKALNDLPLKKKEGRELPQWILSSLKKGNAVNVDMVIEGEDRKASMVANPQFKTIDVFDDKGKRIMQGNGNTIGKKEKAKETVEQKVPVQDNTPQKETGNKSQQERVSRKPKPVHKEMESAAKGLKH